jgi:uncharacterized protein involved in exopolysaccharide biosynthesis
VKKEFPGSLGKPGLSGARTHGLLTQVAGHLEEDLYVSHYVQLLRRNWIVVSAATLLGAIVGCILVLYVLPRQYRAVASVLFDPSSTTSSFPMPANMPASLSPVLRQFGLGTAGSGASMMALAVGQSQTIRFEVVDRLDLVKQLEALGKFDAEQKLNDMTSMQLADTGTMAIHVSILGTPRGILPQRDDDLERRTLARDIANEYVSLIAAKLDSLTLTRSQRKADFLEERVAQAKQELDEAGEALAQVQGEVEYVAPIPSMPPEINALATYEKERAILAADEAAAADELAELKSQLSQEELMVLSQVVSQRSTVADRLKEDVAEARAELAALHDRGYSDEHPECRDLLVRIKALEETYSQEIEEGLRTQSETMATNQVRSALLTRISALEGELAAASAGRSAMDTQVAMLRSRIAALPGAMERVAALQTELEVKATIYGVVNNAYEMARAEAEENAPKLTVLDEAIIPPKKIAPSGSRICVTAAIAGFLLGLMIAPSRDRARRARKGQHEEGRGSPEDDSRS